MFAASVGVGGNVKHILHRIGPFVLASLLGASLVAGAPAEEHNFVLPDLTWHAPDPLPPGQYRYNVQLFDTKSLKHDGDTVRFDTLVLSDFPAYMTPNYPGAPAPSPPGIKSTITHNRASCSWRTIRQLRPAQFWWPFAADAKAVLVDDSKFDNFVLAGAAENRLIDAACAEKPLVASEGANSVDDAVAFWRPYLGAPELHGSAGNTITVQRIIGGTKPAQQATDKQDRRLVQTAMSDDTGNRLFLDLASVQRDGDTVTAQSLVVLGARAERGYGSTPLLRTVRYDCAARTLTVVATARWSVNGGFVGQVDKPFAARRADESPVAAADLRAACDGATGTVFPSTDAAWDAVRATWPPVERPGWIACLWNHYPPDARAQFIAEWRQRATLASAQAATQTAPGAAPDVKAEVLRMNNRPKLTKPEPAAVEACGAPDNPFVTMPVMIDYASTRGALALLAARSIDESEIVAAWNALPWREQEKFRATAFVWTYDDLRLRNATVDRVAQRLGIDRSDTTLWQQLEQYLVYDAMVAEQTR